MAIEGPLKELGIHDVFQLLDLSRKTGVLRVTSQLRRNHGVIQFEEGAVVSASVRSNPHRLGLLLVRAGKITEAELELASEMQERGDTRRLGAILVEIGAITQRELEHQVRLQVEEVIFEVMGWREGYFSFTEGPLEDRDADAIVRIPTEALLMEAARRIDEWSRIERQVPHLGVVPALRAMDEGDEGLLDLLPSEWEVLAMIDGTSDLRHIAGTLGRSDFDVAKTVFGLQTAGVVDLIDPDRGRDAGQRPPDLAESVGRITALLADGDVAGAHTEAVGLVEGRSGSAEAHLALGRVELASARAADAEAAIRRALELDPVLLPAHQLLGDALAMQGRFGEAAEWWTRWLTAGTAERDDPAEARLQVTAAVDAARTLEAMLRGRHGG